MLTETSKLLLGEGVSLSGIYKNFKRIHSIISCLPLGTQLSIGYLEKHSPYLQDAESIDGEETQQQRKLQNSIKGCLTRFLYSSEEGMMFAWKTERKDKICSSLPPSFISFTFFFNSLILTFNKHLLSTNSIPCTEITVVNDDSCSNMNIGERIGGGQRDRNDIPAKITKA